MPNFEAPPPPTSNNYNQNISGMFNWWGRLNRDIWRVDRNEDGVFDEDFLSEIREDFDPETGLNEDGINIDEFLAEEFPYLEELKAARADIEPFLTDALKTAYNYRLLEDGSVQTQWAGQITDTQDITSKGMEAEIIINPTSNWRIAINAARQETILTNFAPRLERIIEDLWAPHILQYGWLDWSLPIGPLAGDSMADNRNDFLLDYFALAGQRG